MDFLSLCRLSLCSVDYLSNAKDGLSLMLNSFINFCLLFPVLLGAYKTKPKGNINKRQVFHSSIRAVFGIAFSMW